MKTSKQRQEELTKLTDDAQFEKLKVKVKTFLEQELEKQFDYEDAIFCTTGKTLSGYCINMDDFLLNYPETIIPTIIFLAKDILTQNGYRVLLTGNIKDSLEIIRIQNSHISPAGCFYPIYFVHALDGEE